MNTPDEFEREEAYAEFVEEVSQQAIEEFTLDRLRSYYIRNPSVMRPAVDAIQEGKSLLTANHPAAALVFFVTAIEVLLKSTVLKPVVHGLVHNATLAEVIVEHALGQTGFVRYTKLLSKLYVEFSGVDIKAIVRPDQKQDLLTECSTLQGTRNNIIHQGVSCTTEIAAHGLEVAVAVYQSIVLPVLAALRLIVGEKGVIEQKRF